MRTSNPALSEEAFDTEARMYHGPAVMTLGGAVAKTVALVVILAVTAGLAWSQLHYDAGSAAGRPGWFYPLLVGSSIGGLIVAMVTIFVPKFSPVTAPIYAALEGVVLGLISALFEAQYAGIVLQALGLTVAVLTGMLFLYATRIIPVTDNLRLGIVAATGAIALVYLATFALSFFGVRVPYIHDSGLIGIGFSLFVVGVAAFNLVLDFDFIERGAQARAPKYMEWYAGFGLLVTLVWLYLEVLKLLAKLRNRD